MKGSSTSIQLCWILIENDLNDKESEKGKKTLLDMHRLHYHANNWVANNKLLNVRDEPFQTCVRQRRNMAKWLLN